MEHYSSWLVIKLEYHHYTALHSITQHHIGGGESAVGDQGSGYEEGCNTSGGTLQGTHCYVQNPWSTVQYRKKSHDVIRQKSQDVIRQKLPDVRLKSQDVRLKSHDVTIVRLQDVTGSMKMDCNGPRLMDAIGTVDTQCCRAESR